MFAAIGIATIKATLVALFFMHLLHDKPMNAIILCTAFTMLGLLLTFCFLDSGTRYNIVPAKSSAAPAGIDFNRPKNLGVPYAGEKSHGNPPAWRARWKPARRARRKKDKPPEHIKH